MTHQGFGKLLFYHYALLLETFIININRLIDQLERMEYIKGAIQAIRKDIPDGAIEAERESLRYGSTQSLM